MAKASIDVHPPQDQHAGADVVSLLLDTLSAIGMSDKEACFYMKFDASQFSRAKRGEARLPIDALWALPDRFWLEFRSRVDAARNLTTERASLIKAERIAELVKLLVMTA